MFFVVSKAVWLLLAPSHLIFECLGAAVVLWAFGRRREGQIAALAASGLYLVLGVLPMGSWMAAPLENRFPRGPWPAHIDGVLTLGGGLNTAVLRSRGAPGATPVEGRLVSTMEVARRYAAAKVVFSGGWGTDSDSIAARYIFGQMGLDPHRLVIEDRSRDTLENLIYSSQLVRPHPGEVWLLATSAVHMPRAMLAAQRVGWNVLPWPTDYMTSRGGGQGAWSVSPGLKLMMADEAAHEWLGLLAYRMRR